METAIKEITLVLFTTVAPAGVVGYVAMMVCAALASGKARADAISRYLVVPLVLVITGLIASATHLGTPVNALYVLLGVGRSPLSNEVVAAVLFLAVGGVYWMLSFRDDVPRWVRWLFLAASAVTGAGLVAFVALAYSVASVPTWNLPTAPVTLCLSALSSGPLVGLLGLLLARQNASMRAVAVLLGVSVASTVANVAVLFVEWGMLQGIATTVIAAPDLVPAFPAAVAAYGVLSLVAVVLAALVFVRGGMLPALRAGGQEGVSFACVRMRRAVAACVAVALSLAACFIVRFAFYAMHMTVGV